MECKARLAPMADYKDIKIPPEVFERLKRDKPRGESWGRYLDNLHEDAQEWRNRRSDVL